MPQPYGGRDEPAAEVEVPGGAEPGPEPPGTPGLNWPLLGAFLVILALVAASNVWLRRRALRERDREDEATPPPS